MNLFDLVDVGLCRWWDCLIWWMSSVGCGFVWFGGWFVLISLDVFFFFFFEVALVDVRQWLLVAVSVVAAVVVGGRCCRMVVGPGLVMKMMMIVIGIGMRKYIILLCSKYYFNV